MAESRGFFLMADAALSLDAHIEAALCLAEAYGRAGRIDAAAEVLVGMVGLEAAAMLPEALPAAPAMAVRVQRLRRKAQLLLDLDMPVWAGLAAQHWAVDLLHCTSHFTSYWRELLSAYTNFYH